MKTVVKSIGKHLCDDFHVAFHRRFRICYLEVPRISGGTRTGCDKSTFGVC